ncbi:peptidyl-prolyl cis-trans isomerase [Trypanosoma brucei equiperdum]|uniref:peptidylprolyl isomerase n=2 Tax=Trypanosoma brucei TaxID=5691 RepID=A0A3L6L5B5_9TRYP|nr:peptidyl-prolyl cis-trans isomerase [Trypanosoma brucei equiperdum]
MVTSTGLLSRVAAVEKAAEIAKPPPPKVVELTEAAKQLPQHIIGVTDPTKLNAQVSYFQCPPWAALPSVACHLQCTRDGVPLPALGLHRFPFYLFGRSKVCDYVLEHPSISSVHAVLVFHGGQRCFVLMDLGSTNGVKLNGNRIEKRRPLPAPVGSSIQFGFSSRVYKVQLGPPSSSKRLREEQERQEAEEGKRKCVEEDQQNGTLGDTRVSPSTSGAVSNEERTEGNVVVDRTVVESVAAETKEVVTCDGVLETSVQAGAPPPTERHFYHVLVKHKDVRRPSSLAPRNKGEKITRSRADAINLAQAILAQHKERKTWSLDEFVQVVRDFSECGSAKRDGDLGMVESGTYTEGFDTVAFSLKSGEVSAPVETELGVHLIYRVE